MAIEQRVAVIIPTYRACDHILHVINEIGAIVSRIYVIDDCCPDRSTTISLSGLATVSSLFFIATAADYRYIIWMIFSSLISVTILGADMLNIRKGSDQTVIHSNKETTH